MHLHDKIGLLRCKSINLDFRCGSFDVIARVASGMNSKIRASKKYEQSKGLDLPSGTDSIS